MPYRIISHPTQRLYAVETIDSGRLHGWTNLKNAQAQKRLLISLIPKEKR